MDLPFSSHNLLKAIHHTSVALSWLLDTRLQLDSSLDNVQRVHDQNLRKEVRLFGVPHQSSEGLLPRKHQPPHLRLLAELCDNSEKLQTCGELVDEWQWSFGGHFGGLWCAVEDSTMLGWLGELFTDLSRAERVSLGGMSDQSRIDLE